MSLRNMFECRYGCGMIMNEVMQTFVLKCGEEAEGEYQEHGPSKKIKGYVN